VSECGKLSDWGWECEVVGRSSFPRMFRAPHVGVITFSVRTGEPKDYKRYILLRCYPLIRNFDEIRRVMPPPSEYDGEITDAEEAARMEVERDFVHRGSGNQYFVKKSRMGLEGSRVTVVTVSSSASRKTSLSSRYCLLDRLPKVLSILPQSSKLQVQLPRKVIQPLSEMSR
jgi:hypothetical protein